SDPVLRVHLIGTGEFAKVHVIRDGGVVYMSEPRSREVSFEWRDTAPPAKGGASYYYVRGEQKDGNLVWASPMWIHQQCVSGVVSLNRQVHLRRRTDVLRMRRSVMCGPQCPLRT